MDRTDEREPHGGPPAGVLRVVALGYLTSDAGTLDPAQRHRLERFCAMRGWVLRDVLHDAAGHQRRASRRPALARAMQLLVDGEATCLIVPELERVGASVAELGSVIDALARAGTRLVSLDPPMDTALPAGRAAARVLSVIGRRERERAAERSRRALEAAREKGALQPAIPPSLKRRIARMRDAGMTLQAIVDELNAAGVPTVRGGEKWRPSSVQSAIGYKRPARA